MKKRIRILAIVCLLLVLVTFVINAILCSMAEDIHYRCFNAIDDFSRLESYKAMDNGDCFGIIYCIKLNASAGLLYDKGFRSF